MHSRQCLNVGYTTIFKNLFYLSALLLYVDRATVRILWDYLKNDIIEKKTREKIITAAEMQQQRVLLYACLWSGIVMRFVFLCNISRTNWNAKDRERWSEKKNMRGRRLRKPRTFTEYFELLIFFPQANAIEVGKKERNKMRAKGTKFHSIFCKGKKMNTSLFSFARFLQSAIMTIIIILLLRPECFDVYDTQCTCYTCKRGCSFA